MLLGKPAPSFSCQAVIDGQIQEFSLEKLPQCTKVLFFYPLDFSFVCPTELHAFQQELPAFIERNVTVIGVSVDSVYSHLTWLSQEAERGGIKGISFPLLSDITKAICTEYEVLNEEEGIAYRGLFIIDEENIVQHISLNSGAVGRNVQEVLRLVDAIQFARTHGQVCPANWTPGKEAIDPTPDGLQEYLHHKA